MSILSWTFSFNALASTPNISKTQTQNSMSFSLSYTKKSSYSDKEIRELERAGDLLLKQEEKEWKQYLAKLANEPDTVAIIQVEEEYKPSLVDSVSDSFDSIFEKLFPWL